MILLGALALLYFIIVFRDEESRWKLRCEQQRQALEAIERYFARRRGEGKLRGH